MNKLSKEELLDGLSNLTLSEFAEFIELFVEKFNLKDTMGSMVSVATDSKPTEEEAGDTKSEFLVELTNVGPNKIKVIKELRTLDPSLGLKEAKELTDKIPSIIFKNADKELADKCKESIENLGGSVKIS